jgi:hypothetical protein
MANEISAARQELESDYMTYAQLCLDKHGHPWPVSREKLKDTSDQELLLELKKLRALARIPHE